MSQGSMYPRMTTLQADNQRNSSGNSDLLCSLRLIENIIVIILRRQNNMAAMSILFDFSPSPSCSYRSGPNESDMKIFL